MTTARAPRRHPTPRVPAPPARARAAADAPAAFTTPGASTTPAASATPAQLVPPGVLRDARRILFVTHLAIGDFTYLQGCLRAFAEAHPHIELHLWVDERRRTDDPAQWEHLRRYALYDWLAACPWIAKVYDRTYNTATLRASVREAQAMAYPLVVSLAVVDCHRYARLAREIGPDAFVFGLTRPAERALHAFSRMVAYRRLDASLPVYRDPAGQHISDIYAGWFQRCFGLAVAPARRWPRLDIPARWDDAARARLAAWGLAHVARADLVFVNPWSKSPDRTWPLERVIELVRALPRRPGWHDAHFIVNVVPEELAQVRALLARHGDTALARVRLFCAETHFFELPAAMRLCGLVISVETAVMHLANAVRVPVIALMRANHPEWAPIDKAASSVVMVAKQDDWVAGIAVDQVLAQLEPRPGA